MPAVPLLFTPMTIDDVPVVAELEKRCFPAPWSAESFRHEVTLNPRAFYWVIRPNPLIEWRDLPPIAAYGGYWLMGDEAHIVTIASHPDWRRRGLGEWLFVAMIERARQGEAHSVTLEVRVGNEAAQALYRKWGFEVVGLRKRYYRDNDEDALLMTLFGVDNPAVWQPIAAAAARYANGQ